MSWLYYLLSLLSGAALTVQVGVNNQLREKVNSPVLSSLLSFSVGALCLGIVFALTALRGTYVLPRDIMGTGFRWWMFTGGLFGAFYILTTILATPKIGMANMLSLAICGQIILAVIFDHLGITGNHMLNPYRLTGVVLLLTGAYMIQKF